MEIISFLNLVFVNPLVEIFSYPIFFAEVVISGLLTGVMYSLVALGFVLIFKASGVFNFAQGAMVLFAALNLVGFIEQGFPIWLALLLTIIVMIILAFLIERFMLRHLINQEDIILFMATIGLTFLLQGFGETLWGSNVKPLDLGIPNQSFEVAGLLLNEFDLFAAGSGAILVGVLAVFFHYTRIGRALRAAKSGVQFSLSLIALKALPVLILGGFTSVPGAIVGGLIIGVGEKIAEIYWGPLVGGAIENWFAYFMALVFLLFRPQGLFGRY